MKAKFLIIILSVVLFACREEEETTLDNPSIKFNFKHLYKEQTLVVSTDNNLLYTTLEGNAWNVKSLKYYVSKLIIYKENGEAYDVNMVKLINPAEPNPAYQEYTLSDIPEGRYTRMSFVFGVDTLRNKFLGLGNTSESNAMEWPGPLGGGYHFMMMEGVFRNDTNALVGYAIHLGKNPNQYYADFPIDVTAQKGKSSTIDIVMNVDQWFDGYNDIDLNDGYGYIMDDDAKQLLFKQNASSVFSIQQQ